MRNQRRNTNTEFLSVLQNETDGNSYKLYILKNPDLKEFHKIWALSFLVLKEGLFSETNQVNESRFIFIFLPFMTDIKTIAVIKRK